MLFYRLCEYFESFEKESSRIKTMHLLKDLLSESKNNTKEVIYLLQGSVAPRYASKEFSFGERYLLASISKAYGYDISYLEKKLLEIGDIGSLAYELSKNRKQSSLFNKSLSIKEVFSVLQKIADTTGNKAIDRKQELFMYLLNNSKALEAKFLCRIILGKLRFGISNASIIDALSLFFLNSFMLAKPLLKEEYSKKYKEDYERYMRYAFRDEIEQKYNIHPDLAHIAESLFKGYDYFKKISLRLFVPILPALAERSTIEDAVKRHKITCVEPKYDGFRLQIHYDCKKVKIYSRGLEDMTELMPDVVKNIKKAFSEPVIIDCEALAYDKIQKKYYDFQTTIKRKRKYSVEELSKELPLHLKVFDIMYYKDRVLVDIPFKERRVILEKAISSFEAVSLTLQIKSSDTEEIKAFFKKSISDGYEGIMLKDPNAIYKAGKRAFAWIKYKASYGSIDSFDLLVMGIFKGKGQRSKGIGALLLGCYNKERDVFETVAKLGSGFKDEQIKEFYELFMPFATKEKPANYDSNIEPDFWLAPNFVVEVLADEITKSPLHTCAKKETGGLSIRFPRFISLRSDKSPYDVENSSFFVKLFKDKH